MNYFSDIDECLTYSDKCHQHAFCFNTKGTFDCHCNQGFTGDGYFCEGIFILAKMIEKLQF